MPWLINTRLQSIACFREVTGILAIVCVSPFNKSIRSVRHPECQARGRVRPPGAPLQAGSGLVFLSIFCAKFSFYCAGAPCSLGKLVVLWGFCDVRPALTFVGRHCPLTPGFALLLSADSFQRGFHPAKLKNSNITDYGKIRLPIRQ